MLSQFVGPVSAEAAVVLVAVFVCICIMTTAMIVKRRSRQDVNNEFELAKMKQEGENERAMFVVETSRAVEFKRIDQNLITSHRADAG